MGETDEAHLNIPDLMRLRALRFSIEGILLACPNGLCSPDNPVFPQPQAELGEVIAGTKKGRESDSERIIGFNYGLALGDIALASEILTRAQAASLGTPRFHRQVLERLVRVGYLSARRGHGPEKPVINR